MYENKWAFFGSRVGGVWEVVVVILADIVITSKAGSVSGFWNNPWYRHSYQMSDYY